MVATIDACGTLQRHPRTVVQPTLRPDRGMLQRVGWEHQVRATV
jgi:hypothetical protein